MISVDHEQIYLMKYSCPRIRQQKSVLPISKKAQQEVLMKNLNGEVDPDERSVLRQAVAKLQDMLPSCSDSEIEKTTNLNQIIKD